jgi:hypothetical protein
VQTRGISIDDLGDVVRIPGVIERVGGDQAKGSDIPNICVLHERDVKRVKNARGKRKTVRVMNGHDDSVEKNDAETSIGRSPLWDEKGRVALGDLA